MDKTDLVIWMGNKTFCHCQTFYLPETDEIIVFGSKNDPTISLFPQNNTENSKSKTITTYPYKIIPDGHTVISYYNSTTKERIFISFGGYSSTNHMIQYNYKTKKFLNLRRKYKLKLKNYDIVEHSKAQIMTHNNKKYHFLQILCGK